MNTYTIDNLNEIVTKFKYLDVMKHKMLYTRKFMESKRLVKISLIIGGMNMLGIWIYKLYYLKLTI